MMKLGFEFFNAKVPVDDTLSIQVLVSEIFVISVDVNFCAEKCSATFFEDSNDC